MLGLGSAWDLRYGVDGQLAADPKESTTTTKIIKILKESKVSGGGGWKVQGRTVKVTTQEFKILKDQSMTVASWRKDGCALHGANNERCKKRRHGRHVLRGERM